MTLYGIDIASYQAGLNLAEVKAEGFDVPMPSQLEALRILMAKTSVSPF